MKTQKPRMSKASRSAMRSNLLDYMGYITPATLEHYFPHAVDKMGVAALSDEALTIYNAAVQARRRRAVANMTSGERTERRAA